MGADSARGAPDSARGGWVSWAAGFAGGLAAVAVLSVGLSESGEFAVPTRLWPDVGARRLLETKTAKKCFPDTRVNDYGRVDRRAVLAELLGEHAPLAKAPGPDLALLLAHRNKGWIGVEMDAEKSVDALSKCDEVDVAVVGTGQGKCAVISQTNSKALTYHALRYERDGNAFALIDRLHEAKLRLPSTALRARALHLLFCFVQNRDSAFSQLRDLISSLRPKATGRYFGRRLAARKSVRAEEHSAARKSVRGGVPERGGYGSRVLVMVTDAGDVDLVVNFICGARSRSLDVSNLVVFCGDAFSEDVLRRHGVATFRHAALGAAPARVRPGAHQRYGDREFVDMMWLKIVSVYMVNQLGHDVLFQDADVVWFKDPWTHLYPEEKNTAGARRLASSDTAWMDDGARTTRFSPWFANSGFYLVRSNPRTEMMCTTFLSQYDLVIAWQSHQAVLGQTLQEAHSLHGVSIEILDPHLFVSGGMKPFLLADRGRPVVFHNNFTPGKLAKVKSLERLGLWTVDANCLNSTRGCCPHS
ncbi:nucleotide-diphospho-sugar transferase-domain-containing protein [Pelagophyceae sp. CCMP2097]|nr:nucleotide-diphospho-sugar transferase-domain-containing protein [Pelagophyceae sp. CCMP2097]